MDHDKQCNIHLLVYESLSRSQHIALHWISVFQATLMILQHISSRDYSPVFACVHCSSFLILSSHLHPATMSDQLRDPTWDPVLQQWEEEAYFGCGSSPVNSNNSAEYNQRIAESYEWDGDFHDQERVGADNNRNLLGCNTPEDPETEFPSPSTEIEVLHDPAASEMRARPGALRAPAAKSKVHSFR